MESAKSKELADRSLPVRSVQSVVEVVSNLKAEEGNHITWFGYLILVSMLILGIYACRLLLL